MTARRNLFFFFGLAYFSQGLAGTLIQQPLAYHLKSDGMAVNHVAQALAFVAIPWIVKPFYGVLSDSIPLFGYRRKSYLVFATSLSTFGYLAMSLLSAPPTILAMLFVTTLGMAAMDVLVDALMVEEGQKTGLIRQFQAQQWTWVNIASITAAALGGWLIEVSTPVEAVQWAALLIAFAPLAVLTSTVRFIEERRVFITEPLLISLSQHVMMAVRSRRVWVMAGFLAYWNLIPNFTLPLYYHMTDQLQFGQGFIGQLHAIGAAAAAIAAYLYRTYLTETVPMRTLPALSIALNAATAFGYLLLSSHASAQLLHIVSGVVSMLALLTFFSLAASVCRPEAAAFTFALLMAIYSIAGQLSGVASAHLYQAFLWIPILPVDRHDAIFVRPMAG